MLRNFGILTERLTPDILMLNQIIFILLSLAASAFIVYPLLKARAGSKPDFDSNHRATDLEERKDNIYAAIKEIEFDFEMGKLSEEDFHTLRQQYKNDAIELLKEIDKTRPVQTSTPVKKSAKTKSAGFCWNCGAPLRKEDKFCSGCGTNLAESN